MRPVLNITVVLHRFLGFGEVVQRAENKYAKLEFVLHTFFVYVFYMYTIET